MCGNGGKEIEDYMFTHQSCLCGVGQLILSMLCSLLCSLRKLMPGKCSDILLGED